MSESQEKDIKETALENLAEWKELAEKSQSVVKTFIENQANDDAFSIVDPSSIGKAFFDMNAKLLSDPEKLAETQKQIMADSMKLWQSTMTRMLGKESEPAATPEPGDRRFKDKAWEEQATFDYIKQSYLLSSRWLTSLVNDAEGLDPQEKERVDFYTRQFISAMSPSNFAATNPAVMKKVHDTGGKNLLDGLKNMLKDMEKGKGKLKISMTDMDAFTVGENIASTEGKVIYQNELMQLIQYSPTTEEVYKKPLLIVPPWINKFYILDLQPKNSFLKWVVDQGYTLFIISWINPTKELSHKSFEDYMIEGPLTAIDVISDITGEKDLNILGFCIGGILVEAMLGWMAKKGDKRVKSATLLTTLLDFNEVGEVSVFIDDDLVTSLEKHMEEKGYLEGRHMAQMFNMMRENDLIWSFVVNNYLMGREPMPFDLLYWNSDSTRLPAAMLLYYLKHIYQENGLAKKDHLKLHGEKIDVSKIKTPIYSIATKDDHIAPWVSCYPVTQKFAGPVRFVLGGSGHIAGAMNHPAANKYGYWTNSDYPEDAMEWFGKADAHEGSWWLDWNEWLAKKSGKKVPARVPGEGKYKAIEDAPGSYVKSSTDE